MKAFFTILFLPLLSGAEALPASAFYYIIGLKNALTDSMGFLLLFSFGFFRDCFGESLNQGTLAL